MSKGYITVFFSLAVSVCLSLLLVMVAGARESAVRYKATEAMNISMRSAFGEYRRELWERYGFVYIDSDFGYREDSLIIPEEHLVKCMNRNFDEERFVLLNGLDLLKLSCNEAETVRVRFATDDGGYSLRLQAENVMMHEYGLAYLNDLYSMAMENNKVLEYDEPINMPDEGMEELAGIEDASLKEWDVAEDAAVFAEEDAGALLTLRMVLKDISDISTISLNEELYPENRELNAGNYEIKKEESLLDVFAFKEYLLDRCSSYTSAKEDTVMKYEVEYLLTGNCEDAKNLERTVNRILLLREAANLETLYSDSVKTATLKLAAESLSSLCANPELTPVFEVILAGLWSYAESVYDLRVLLDGGKVPIIKTDEEWKTDLDSALSDSEAGEGYETGMTYRDYLRVFLTLSDKEKLTERFENLVEANIRTDIASNDFRLDACFDAWEVTAYVSSEYGHDYTLTRSYLIEDY